MAKAKKSKHSRSDPKKIMQRRDLPLKDRIAYRNQEEEGDERYDAVEAVMFTLMLALHDHFGFGIKRLTLVSHAAAEQLHKFYKTCEKSKGQETDYEVSSLGRYMDALGLVPEDCYFEAMATREITGKTPAEIHRNFVRQNFIKASRQQAADFGVCHMYIMLHEKYGFGTTRLKRLGAIMVPQMEAVYKGDWKTDVRPKQKEQLEKIGFFFDGETLMANVERYGIPGNENERRRRR